jgi:N-sulfoglucosamine sulfohydrolase
MDMTPFRSATKWNLADTTRRDFLGVSAPALLAAAESRPNILLVISDDQSWEHTGAAGDPYVRTQAFDRVARVGVLFTHTFCASPSCAPSRAAVLTGQEIWRLEQGANMRSHLSRKFAVYPDLLETAGYKGGYAEKGWGPGRLRRADDYMIAGGDERDRNPAGEQFGDQRQRHGRHAAGKMQPLRLWRPHAAGDSLA